MLLDFLRRTSSEGGLDHVVARSVAMLGDARHSFDLASLALLTDTDPADVEDDVRATDVRINDGENELRAELVVHVSVQGSADIGTVLGFVLLLKKIERIGDQAKNILDLALNGVSLAGFPEAAGLRDERQAISTLFGEAADLLGDPATTDEAVAAFDRRAREVTDALQERIDGYMDSDRPGREVVPLAIYDRYVRRTVANLAGVVRTSVEPLDLGAEDDPED